MDKVELCVTVLQVPEKAINGMDVCYVATVVNGTEGVNCDFENGRQKITFPKLMKDFRTNYNKVHDWSPVYHAPYFSYNVSITAMMYMYFIYCSLLISRLDPPFLQKIKDYYMVYIYIIWLWKGVKCGVKVL